MTTTPPTPRCAGLPHVEDRPLTGEERSELLRTARRARSRGWAFSALLPVAFVAFVALGVMVRLRWPDIGDGLPVVTGGLHAAATLALLSAASRAFAERRLLAADLEAGTIRRFRGCVDLGASASEAQRRLLRMGILSADPGREQEVEALSVSRRVWAVNGARPARAVIAEPWGGANAPTPRRLPDGFWLGLSAVVLTWYVSRSVIPANLPARYLLGLGATVAAYALTITVHEVGHLLAGWAVGLRFMLLTVGPFGIFRTVAGPRPRRSRLGHVMGGVTVCVPTDTAGFARRMAVFVAGGPVMSLIAGLAAVAWAWSRDGVSFSVTPGWAGAAYVWGLGTVWFGGLVPLLPAAVGGRFLSDGANLLLFWRGGPGVRRAAATAALIGQGIEGVRPRDWDQEWVDTATRALDGAVASGGRLLAYYHALDRGDIAGARECLAALSSDAAAPPPMRSLVSLEAAYLAARFEDDAPVARARLDAVDARLVDKHNRMRAMAAVLLAEGRYPEAASTARAGLAALGGAESAGFAAASRDWLDDLLDRAARAVK